MLQMTTRVQIVYYGAADKYVGAAEASLTH